MVSKAKQTAIQGVSLQFGLQCCNEAETCHHVHIMPTAETKDSQSALASFNHTILEHVCWWHALSPESSR